MVFALLKHGLGFGRFERQLPAARDLKPSYDVVIIGGGGHGLATAYYLARDWGITNVAMLEKGYLGGGNTGRNTTIIRSNYLTAEGVRFYDESVRLFRDLAQRSRHQSDVCRARPSDARTHRCRDADFALARRSQQASWRQFRAHRPR